MSYSLKAPISTKNSCSFSKITVPRALEVIYHPIASPFGGITEGQTLGPSVTGDLRAT